MAQEAFDSILFRRYSTSGLAQAAVDQLGGRGRMVFRPDGNERQPFVVEPVREQLREAGAMLAVMVVAFPPLFMLADWLRYGGV